MLPMRRTFALTLGVLVVALAPAADTPPLLKPVAPPNGNARLRLPIDTSGKSSDSQLRGQIMKGQGKKGSKSEPVDVLVAFDTLPGKAVVSQKKWQSWGFEVPANKIAVLPELV